MKRTKTKLCVGEYVTPNLYFYQSLIYFNQSLIYFNQSLFILINHLFIYFIKRCVVL